MWKCRSRLHLKAASLSAQLCSLTTLISNSRRASSGLSYHSMGCPTIPRCGTGHSVTTQQPQHRAVAMLAILSGQSSALCPRHSPSCAAADQLANTNPALHRRIWQSLVTPQPRSADRGKHVPAKLHQATVENLMGSPSSFVQGHCAVQLLQLAVHNELHSKPLPRGKTMTGACAHEMAWQP